MVVICETNNKQKQTLDIQRISSFFAMNDEIFCLEFRNLKEQKFLKHLFVKTTKET